MAALVGNLTSVGNSFDVNWSLLFARQPEPDLEFTEEELDQTTSTRATGPLNPRKKSGGGRPILWMLLLVLVGGIAYVATMEPEMLAEWLSPYLGESTPPPVAMKPKPLAPSSVAPPAPEPQAALSPSDTAPAPAPPVAAVAPASPAATPPQVATKPAAPVTPPPAPMFGEGQKVTVTADPIAPGGTIPLYADSTANKPGPLVRAGVTLTVLDGDLQLGGWMYLVRSDEGAKGWVSEKRLRLKF
ncbi:MAG: hypothetical protein AAB242_13295 [Nitrospirota bacterium]